MTIKHYDQAWNVKDDKALPQPLRWRRPRRIFVNSTSDLFHESVPDEWIDQVFAVMALCPQHTFMALTKRPERMRAYMSDPGLRHRIAMAIAMVADLPPEDEFAAQVRCNAMPLPNVWLGTSIEDQATADARIPHLLATPAAVRFISAEPLLGPVDLWKWIGVHHHPDNNVQDAAVRAAINKMIRLAREQMGGGLDLVIVGGESGPGARPMHEDWPRRLRDQCVAAGVSFFFKQWGEWETAFQIDGLTAISAALTGTGHWTHPRRYRVHGGALDGHCYESLPEQHHILRLGKKAAGRVLDGRTWDQMPGVRDG